MVTMVGKQTDFIEAVKELLELEYDALEAYDAALKRVQTANYKTMLASFKSDHERHISELSNYLFKFSPEIPKGPSGKQWLTKGKVVLANLMGDKNIIGAMISNELDTNQAYENMNQRPDKTPEISQLLSNGLADERRHKRSLESLILI